MRFDAFRGVGGGEGGGEGGGGMSQREQDDVTSSRSRHEVSLLQRTFFLLKEKENERR